MVFVLNELLLIFFFFTDMYVENGVVEILCEIIVNMQKSLEEHHHELFLSSLNQLLRMSPASVKEICIKVQDLSRALCGLRDSYPDDSTYQVNNTLCIINYFLSLIKKKKILY